MEDKKKVISVDQAKLYVKPESQNKKESVNFKTKQGCCNGRGNPADENHGHPRLANNRELTRSKKRRLRKQKIVPSSVPSLPRIEDIDPPRDSCSVRLQDSSIARSDKDHDAPQAAEAKVDLTKPSKNILNDKKTNEVLNEHDSDRNAPHGAIVKKEVEESTMPTSGKVSRTGEKKRDETAVERETKKSAKNKKKTEVVEEEKSGEAGRKESTEVESSPQNKSRKESTEVESSPQNKSRKESTEVESSPQNKSRKESTEVESSPQKKSRKESTEVESSPQNKSRKESTEVETSPRNKSRKESTEVELSPRNKSRKESTEVELSPQNKSKKESTEVKSSPQNKSRKESTEVESSPQNKSKKESTEVESSAQSKSRKESTELESSAQSKSREEVIAERELRKKTKKEAGGGKGKPPGGAEGEPRGEEKSSAGDPQPEEKTKAQLRAERRAKQEAQRAAKEAEKQQKGSNEKSKDPAKPPDVSKLKEAVPKEKKSVLSPKPNLSRVKLFSHLQYKTPPIDTEMKLDVHPAIVGLGAKYAARVVNGSNARCLAFLQAMKQMITDYITPPEKEFSRGLETQIGPAMIYLHQFRPQPVSVTNALRHIKSHLTQLPNNVSDDEARAKLCEVIETYIREQVHVAALAISKTMQRKIANGDVILTYACSSLLCQLLVESKKEGTEFSVVVVDAGPWFEGREMLRRLTEQGIDCSYVLINALSFIMRKATTVLIGAHALLANGCVMSRAGSSLVALMAHSCNVPVLVCCETHKFSERVQTDAFVYNEFGDPDDIAGEGSSLSEWRSFPSLSPLNLLYDITPPDLVTAVVTELAILPCTSVPVVLRVKPSDLAN